jgi:dTDP-4-dehydrorhamnose 3,5-epimerase
MEVFDLRLGGLKLIKPKVFRDERGFFLEAFEHERYQQLGIGAFVQDNHSLSKKDSLRGMHFQSSPGQAKLVRTAVGRIYDVAVDMRPQSPTFGEWEAVILDDISHHQLYLPVGFAHGFCVLSDEAHVMYKVSSPYHPATEKGFRWDDPSIKIQWPVENPIVSERDREAPFFESEQLIAAASWSER